MTTRCPHCVPSLSASVPAVPTPKGEKLKDGGYDDSHPLPYGQRGHNGTAPGQRRDAEGESNRSGLPDLLAAALTYAERGQPVFPCYPADVAQDDGRVNRAKAPLTRHGLDDASTVTWRIKAWWTRWPQACIGLVTGHRFDVIDVDRKPGGVNGYQALKQLDAEMHLLDTAVTAVSTPSGGLHLYFPADPCRPMANATFARRGIDLRGLGGYVIAPPSVLFDSDGRLVGRYRLEQTRRVEEGGPLDHERVRALLGDGRPVRAASGHPGPRTGHDLRVSEPRPGEGNMDALVHWLSQAAIGDRNSRLFWAACRAVEQGDDPDALVDTALVLGLEPGEVEATIRSARRQGEA